MQKMLDNWPIPEADRAKRLSGEFLDRFKEVGESRFRTAVNSIISARVYSSFPTRGEFNAFIPSPETRHYCGKCIDGFIYASQPDDYGNRQVKLCPCRAA
jgi:hypothetical protein